MGRSRGCRYRVFCWDAQFIWDKYECHYILKMQISINTHMITKYESKYGCRYMYTSYHTDINLYVDTKEWAKSTCGNLKSHSWTWLARPFSGAFWSWWNFPPLIFFRTQLSSLNLALPCGLPASAAVALPGYWKASHPSPRYTEKNCLNQNSGMKKQEATTCNPETNPKNFAASKSAFWRANHQ